MASFSSSDFARILRSLLLDALNNRPVDGVVGTSLLLLSVRHVETRRVRLLLVNAHVVLFQDRFLNSILN